MAGIVVALLLTVRKLGCPVFNKVSARDLGAHLVELERIYLFEI
jgi:hypothetical protein